MNDIDIDIGDRWANMKKDILLLVLVGKAKFRNSKPLQLQHFVRIWFNNSSRRQTD